MPRTQFSSGKGEEIINHYGAVRLRVLGSANLKMKLFSLSEVAFNDLAPVIIAAKSSIEPNRLSNFTQQRAKLEIRTTEINENFRISKVIVFVRPVAKSFPEGAQVPASFVFSPAVSAASLGLVGPQGIPGPQGIQGIQGIAGPTGPQGPTIIPAFAETVESTTYTLTGSMADVTGLSVTITPKLATSKIRIQAVINTYMGSALTVVSYQILRGASVIKTFTTAGFNNNAAQIGTSIVLDYLDSPTTTSATTYKIQAACPNAVSAFVNEPINGGDIVFSSITATEILQ